MKIRPMSNISDACVLFPDPLCSLFAKHATMFTVGTRLSGLAPVETQPQEYRTTLLRAKLLEVLVDLSNVSLP